MKKIFYKAIKQYWYVSLVMVLAGVIFGIVGVLFDFKDLMAIKSIDTRYCYFVNNEGSVEDAIIGETEEDGAIIKRWFEDKRAGTEEFVGTQHFYIISASSRVDVLEYIGPDSGIVKIRATFDHNISLAKQIVGYASPLTLHKNPFTSGNSN